LVERRRGGELLVDDLVAEIDALIADERGPAMSFFTCAVPSLQRSCSLPSSGVPSFSAPPRRLVHASTSPRRDA
jgi:hypothetical protein